MGLLPRPGEDVGLHCFFWCKWESDIYRQDDRRHSLPQDLGKTLESVVVFLVQVGFRYIQTA